MSTRSKNISLILLGLTALLNAGCSDGGNSSFVYGPATLALIPEAQNGIGDLPGVKELIDERFGDPQHLKAWSRLPLNSGGTFGSVAATPEGSVVKELSLEFDEEVPAFSEKEHSLQFVSGDAATTEGGPLRVTIVTWNPETGVAQLRDSLQVVPGEGDQVVLDGGQTLEQGRVLYQRHCSHCHGTSGDGAGPTAPYLTPRPRDYRHGVFKFTSTQGPNKASREDLKRILRHGIPGTYMPSFVPMLKEEELDAVVEYVRLLAMRGEYERRLASELATDYSIAAVQERVAGGENRSAIVGELRGYLGEDIGDSLDFVADDLARSWEEADTEEALVVPTVARVPDTVESRRVGRELFLSKEVACADCHGIDGRGNGPQSTIFEENPVTGKIYDEPGLHDVWDNVNQPRNLKHGIYRGGRRPIDLFRRVHAGIKGTRMPSFKNQSEENIWHIVNYVLSVPFESEPGKSAETPVASASE